jgi:hypothetical protein
MSVQEASIEVHSTPKIALAVITRRLEDPHPVLRFIDNAEQFEHAVDRVIVAHTDGARPAAVNAIEKRTRLDVLRANGDRSLRDRLRSGGLDPQAADELLAAPSWVPHRQVPYSAYRNAVLLHALLEGLDALLFFDTDVFPKVLTRIEGGAPQFHPVDFVGAHFTALVDQRTVASTSDYSGYYIIPPMAFGGLAPLLTGLRKEKALAFVEAGRDHHCLNLGGTRPRRPKPTHKPLGGNLGLWLQHPEDLSLFYSTTYVFRGRCIMGRGEDTLLGRAIAKSSRRIVDIDLPVFHDTYPGFPAVPDIGQAEIRSRFYAACLGWIGRNPFLTWFQDQTDELGLPFEDAIEQQRTGLRVGGVMAAKALDDRRFGALVQAFDASLRALPAAIRRYQRLMAGWDAFLGAFSPPRDRRTNPAPPLDSRVLPADNGWAEAMGPDANPVASSTTVV